MVVAHQDDDFAAAQIASSRLDAGDPVLTVYLTNGDAAEECDEYVRAREQGVKDVYASLVGMPAAPDCAAPGESGCWSEDDRYFHDKLVRMLELRGSPLSLAFFGFGNPSAETTTAYLEPTLERLWAMPGARVSTLSLDGRGRVDDYSKDELISALRSMLEDFDPTHVHTHDPNRQQFLTFPFDHTDHVHAGLFTFAALQRWGKPVELTLERGYSTLFLPVSRSAEDIAESQALVDIYLPYDAKICVGEAELCGQVTECYDPNNFDLAKEHFYSVEVARGSGRKIVTPGGLCLDAWGSWVFAAPCLFFSGTQRWDLLDDGRIRHRASGRCLASDDGSHVELAACAPTPQQRFSVLSNGSLLGPDAQCTTVTGSFVGLSGCALDLRQTGFFAR